MDFFSFIAPAYDWLIPIADLKTLRRHLKLPCDGLLLDLGGGTGRVSAHFRDDVQGEVVVDSSFAMARRVRRQQRVWAVVADGAHLPFRPAVFARALVVDAFHHFRQQEMAMAEVARVLTVGGRLVIEEPDIEKALVRCVALGEKLLGMGSHFLPAARLAQLMASQCLTVSVDQGRSFAMWVVGQKVLEPAGSPPTEWMREISAAVDQHQDGNRS
ncbi:MAG: class I SAM-dependent methyltransferase [Candidatus Oleimicrobiaceae bacterium]